MSESARREAKTSDVEICEVGPRDGLQNENETLPTSIKLELIRRLGEAGLAAIEVTSFVSPEWIPQLADADDLVAQLPLDSRIRYAALVPNSRGWDRFRETTKLHCAALFISASETHNRKNVNRSVSEHLARLGEVVDRARDAGVKTRAYVSTAMGCPYEGEVSPESVLDLSRKLHDRGVDEIALGDTIGVGVPSQVAELVNCLGHEVPLSTLVLHVHDTYGRGLANAIAAYRCGIRKFDSSLGGLGGCPYAPGASGNLATEDLVSLFEAEGISTGIDLAKLVETSSWLESDVLDRRLPSRVLRARLGAG